MVNEVTLIGRLGNDPEVRQAGKATVSRLKVATTRNYKKDGEWQEETQWHTVDVWREFKASKGDLVYVSGRVEYREHEGKWYTSINSNYARNLSPRSEGVAVMDGKPSDPMEPRNDDDLPF